MSDAAVQLDGLTRRFGAHTVLTDMSWSAPAGAVTVVLGPNGAGKTTAVECAEGLQRPDGGTVRVLGADPWRAGPAHRARVGVMLQEVGLPGGARPMSLLRHLASLYAAPADSAALAGRLGLDGFRAPTVRRLSGGQRQRLGLAAALVGRPEVLFLDEPTAGLDLDGRLDVWTLLREQRDAGCALVVTTHSFEEAERLADYVVIVAAGRVLATGTLASVTSAGRLEDVYLSLTRPAA
ncbi:MAG TPA: ABC transporter ATP-binding protein [Dermatophilaceae bacterium]|nr:ABC transporter ATP-binding protein [Dermatophilaceae bacterium]